MAALRREATSGSWRAADGEALVREAELHGLAPLLEAALGDESERALGRAPALGLRSLCALHRRRCRAQRGAFRELVEAADRGGLPICWLKGAAVAATVYQEPSHRPMGDLDLLVAPERVTAAIDLLRSLGFEPAGGTWRRRALSHQLSPARRGTGGACVVLEVHVDALSYLAPGSLVLGRNSSIEPLPARADGCEVATLGPTDTLAQLVAHAVNVRQRFTLIHVADLARWIDTFDASIDWTRLRRESPSPLRRLGWLAQLVEMPGRERLAATRRCDDTGVAYRGWSSQGLRRSRRDVSLARLARQTLAPPEWWARAQYCSGERTPAWWLRWVRHPAHLAKSRRTGCSRGRSGPEWRPCAACRRLRPADLPTARKLAGRFTRRGASRDGESARRLRRCSCAWMCCTCEGCAAPIGSSGESSDVLLGRRGLPEALACLRQAAVVGLAQARDQGSQDGQSSIKQPQRIWD